MHSLHLLLPSSLPSSILEEHQTQRVLPFASVLNGYSDTLFYYNAIRLLTKTSALQDFMPLCLSNEPRIPY